MSLKNKMAAMNLPVKIRRDWHYYAFAIGGVDFLVRTTVTVGTQVVTILLIICWTIG